MSNTAPTFSGVPDTGSDPDVVAALLARRAIAPSQVPNTNVSDVNSITITFTVASGISSIGASFVFGSDEFPDQGVTDFFMFFVDGTNYAYFPDGSLISFVEGANASQFLNNGDGSAGPYDIEYDGLSRVLGVQGILNSALTTHTLKIVIGDTADDIYDSGVFIGGLTAGLATNGGICGGVGQSACPNPPVGPTLPNDDISGVPEPTSMLLAGLGLVAVATLGRRYR